MDDGILIKTNVPLKWMSTCGRYTVSFSFRCFNAMLDIAKKHYPHEVGTSLVGYYSKDGFDAYIVDIAPLTGDSKGSSFTFVRGIKGLREFFGQIHSRFSGKRYYVGEWHSHPNGSVTPSSTDNQTQFSIAADRKTNCPEIILIIIGGHLLEQPELGIFVYSRKQIRVQLFPK